MPADLESIEVSLYKTDDEENDVLLATNVANRKNNAQLFELNKKDKGDPFDVYERVSLFSLQNIKYYINWITLFSKN